MCVRLFDSVVCAERTEHSVKPKQFFNIIETLYPYGERTEVYQRGTTRPGWKRGIGFEAAPPPPAKPDDEPPGDDEPDDDVEVLDMRRAHRRSAP
jgi:hypothetical protein